IAVAIGWQVYSIHRNPLDLGLVGLAEFVPLPLLALPAGQLADRLPRRAVTAFSLVLQLAIAALLVGVTLAGAHEIWPFFAIAALAGVTAGVGSPAARALTPELVPEELLQGAIALRSLAGQIGIIAGPALGGVIFAIEPVAVYAAAAALFTVSLVAILALPTIARAHTGIRPPHWNTPLPGATLLLRAETPLPERARPLLPV